MPPRGRRFTRSERRKPFFQQIRIVGKTALGLPCLIILRRAPYFRGQAVHLHPFPRQGKGGPGTRRLPALPLRGARGESLAGGLFRQKQRRRSEPAAQGKRVQGIRLRDFPAHSRRAHEQGQTFAQLAGRPPGKGHGRHVRRRNATLQQMQRPSGKRAGFSRARSGQNQNRPGRFQPGPQRLFLRL